MRSADTVGPITSAAPTHRQILALAIPIILANSASPLLALTDIAVIGHYGSATDLGAIALGTYYPRLRQQIEQHTLKQ